MEISTQVTTKEHNNIEDGHTSPSTHESTSEQVFLADMMKQTEFRSILDGYIQDISLRTDKALQVAPVNTSNQEQVPIEKNMVTPTAEFVMKTKWDVQHKVFINICTSATLQPLSSKKNKIDTSQQSTFSWHFSYGVGLERLEKDQRGAEIPTLDICVHPQVAKVAVDRLDPRGPVVINKCLDAVERILQRSRGKSAAVLDRNYHVLRGVLYKSGCPKPMCLKEECEVLMLSALERVSDGDSLTATKVTIDLDNVDIMPSQLMKTANDCADDVVQNELMCGANVDCSTMFKEEVLEVKSDVKEDCEEVKLKKKVEHQIIYRGRYEALHNAQVGSGNHVAVDSYRPKELVVEMSLPAAASAKGLDLNVSEQMLRLAAGSFASSDYEPLELALPFPVIESKGSARFDRKRHKLVVTLPVQPPQKPEPHFVSLVIQDVDDDENAEAVNEEKQLSYDTKKSSEDLASKQKLKGVSSPPQLERCSDENEIHTTDTCAKNAKSSLDSSLTTPIELTLDPLHPIEPPFKVHITSQCLSYIVDVAGIESSSVELAFPSNTSLRLQFSDSSHGVHELYVAVFPVDIDPSTAEFDVASENMVVILYRKKTPTDQLS